MPRLRADVEVAVGLLASEPPPSICVVAVAAGRGLSNVFRSLGATGIVEGGQTMNPSTAQILDAVEDAVSDQVIILPNNKNILMAAQQAADVSEKQVMVVPTQIGSARHLGVAGTGPGRPAGGQCRGDDGVRLRRHHGRGHVGYARRAAQRDPRVTRGMRLGCWRTSWWWMRGPLRRPSAGCWPRPTSTIVSW